MVKTGTGRRIVETLIRFGVGKKKTLFGSLSIADDITSTSIGRLGRLEDLTVSEKRTAVCGEGLISNHAWQTPDTLILL